MVNAALAVLAALMLFQAAAQPPVPNRRVAITIDDGPVVNEMRDLASFQRISKGLIDSLRAEKVPATVFINERQINVPGQRDGRAAVLEQWLDAGFELGNHTYSHPSLNSVPLRQFADDVVKGEVIMRPLIEQRGRRLTWFRYPFLHSGTTAETHQGILDFLEQRQYRVAPVTVDYADYTFAGVYRNQLARGAPEVAAQVRQAYLEQVDVGFDYAEKVSTELFGSEVPQILLIHCNELNSITLRETVARLRKRGYAFITLDEAMQDPVYQRPDTFEGPGGSWLSRSATAMGKPIVSASRPRVPDWIVELTGAPRSLSAVAAQEEVAFDGRPARIIDNDKLSLTIRSVGGTMVQLLMKDDAERLNPLDGLGHFVCVDGFGPVSAEERAAGMPGHGEAHRVGWEMLSAEKRDRTLTVRFTATLPLVQEVFRRTIRMVDGESVVYIDSELVSLLGFDRPVNWAEHPTIGGPFLQQGKTVTEMPATRAITRSHASEATDPPEPHQLADFKEFSWPMAPTIGGGLLDMRTAPVATPILDHTASLMDPSRRLVFVTAFHPDKKALFGYVFRREEYPWIQIWDSYPGGGRRSYRGLEFASQPFDLPRREVIQTSSMFGTPTYRWLPARGTIGSGFVMFYTRTPDGFTKVDDVVLADGKLTIEDRRSGKTIVLLASRGL